MRCETDTLRKERYRIEENILFGKYRIISTLGTGNSSTVYLARHLKLKVYRAIKCIPKDTADTSSIFTEGSPYSEAYLLKTLNHPGIPLIYDIDEDDTFIYLVEEFIQGDSLEDMIHYPEHNISQELILKYGIQLCDILDYLHHIAPYPILYQDLKPEHIIVCGNQIKLIDFGIASFFTGSGQNFQKYGTDGFVAPEAYLGHSIHPASDIYSLGKVLSLMADATSAPCSPQLLDTIQTATSFDEENRYQSAAELKEALIKVRGMAAFHSAATDTACQHSSHLIRQIAVLGSRPGAGATHFAVSLVSILNQNRYNSLYLSKEQDEPLFAMTSSDALWHETDGIYYHGAFAGIPDYGAGIDCPLPENALLVTDYGDQIEECLHSQKEDLIFLILSGSIWDMPDALSLIHSFPLPEKLILICNYNNKKAAKKYAKLLKMPVYCFPVNCNPFRVTAKCERSVIQIIERKEVDTHFRNRTKWNKIPFYHWHHRLLFRCGRHTSGNRPGKSMWL